MNCPHCHQPIDPQAIRKAANSDAARRKRPGAKGLVRNLAGRPKRELCYLCNEPIVFPADDDPRFLGDTAVRSFCGHYIQTRK